MVDDDAILLQEVIITSVLNIAHELLDGHLHSSPHPQVSSKEHASVHSPKFALPELQGVMEDFCGFFMSAQLARDPISCGRARCSLGSIDGDGDAVLDAVIMDQHSVPAPQSGGIARRRLYVNLYQASVTGIMYFPVNGGGLSRDMAAGHSAVAGRR